MNPMALKPWSLQDRASPVGRMAAKPRTLVLGQITQEISVLKAQRKSQTHKKALEYDKQTNPHHPYNQADPK